MPRYFLCNAMRLRKQFACYLHCSIPYNLLASFLSYSCLTSYESTSDYTPHAKRGDRSCHRYVVGTVGNALCKFRIKKWKEGDRLRCVIHKYRDSIFCRIGIFIVSEGDMISRFDLIQVPSLDRSVTLRVSRTIAKRWQTI